MTSLNPFNRDNRNVADQDLDTVQPADNYAGARDDRYANDKHNRVNDSTTGSSRPVHDGSRAYATDANYAPSDNAAAAAAADDDHRRVYDNATGPNQPIRDGTRYTAVDNTATRDANYARTASADPMSLNGTDIGVDVTDIGGDVAMFNDPMTSGNPRGVTGRDTMSL